MGAASTFLAAHQIMGCQTPVQTTGLTQPLIQSITLQTNQSISDMKDFYHRLLGFPVMEATDKRLMLQTGLSTLSFEKNLDSTVRPFYHFAFNIPENLMDQAFEWQRRKTEIVHPGVDGPIDEITHFASWNAHSIFFLDPAGNLVEYIARHDLNNASERDFSIDQILYISEIGFVEEDIHQAGKDLMSSLGVTEYRPSTPGFWPIGDEHGLLLMIAKGRFWRANPGQINESAVFKTNVEISLTGKSWTRPELEYFVKGV